MKIDLKWSGLVAVAVILLATGCTDTNFVEADRPQSAHDGRTSALFHGDQNGPRLVGRTIQDLDVVFTDGSTFVGRITNLTLERVGDEIHASGRLIGRFTTNGVEQINRVFSVVLPVLDANGDPIDVLDPPTVCQILFLELGPIFLDVLGLIVEVPDPIVVEVRAEPGPGQLLGNLLCALLGILG